MATMRTLANTSAGYIADELGYDHDEREAIRFGLEIVIGSAIKGVLILCISYILGILPLVIAVLVTSIILRMLSGGTHLHTYLRCLTFSTSVTICISYAAVVVSPHMDFERTLFLIIFATITAFFFIYRWAPADTPGKPIKNKEKRAIYRKLSWLFVALWSIIITIILIFWQTPLMLTLCLASTGGLLWQVISINPFSYRLADSTDCWLDRVTANGR